MTDETLVRRAIGVVEAASDGPPLGDGVAVTLNFHPDLRIGGALLIERLAADGVYRSQFETGVSNGGMTAFVGGDRWRWESRIFGGVYDGAASGVRPKYGALNLLEKTTGGSPRFGSCHIRLSAHKRDACTFCYPDSHLDPDAFGTARRFGLLDVFAMNPLGLEPLDHYVEAHVHGEIVLARDVDAVVLDPSFRGTPVARAAAGLGRPIEWHAGFALRRRDFARFAAYRDAETAAYLEQAFSEPVLRPSDLTGRRGDGAPPAALKKAWHCMARFGDPDAGDAAG